uniref:BTB domain-containing protein n=1 Tax=Branchiostoma floridae TaxID=7739 RepID=C3ZJE8_BRAFL|eukprot:XP_002591279.1 hypothetical protein BRAFLDRAFT_121427 [Branchiostoma floridae]
MATYDDLEGPSPLQRTTKTRLQQLVYSSFADFRKENLLYDTKLVVGEEEFRAHKILLAACSKYFFSYFKNSGNDVNSVSVVDLTKFREITPEGIRVALDFMYEGKLPEPGDDNLQKKFRATKEFLRIPLYTDYCDVVNEDVLRDLREFVQYSLQSFRSQKVFFDITIKTKGKKFRAHRILLAACSRYFRSMFTLNFKEGKEHEINLADVPTQVSVRSLKDLIELIYTGEIEINVDNFEELLTASFFLQMEFPQDLCAKFIAANIDLENCADVLRLAEGYGMEEVIKAAYYFMQENYDELSQTDHYKRLPEDLAGLLGFLPRKQLAGIAYRQSNYQSAFNSPDIVLYDDKKWKYYFDSRFTSLPKEIADTATFEVAVLDNIIYVIGGFRFHDKRRDFLPTNEVRLWFLYLVTSVTEVHCYDCVFRAWNESSPMINERDLFRTVVVGGEIYAIGGRGAVNNYQSTVERFNPLTFTWKLTEPLPLGASDHAAAECFGHIFVSGDSSCWVDGMPRTLFYHPDTKQWDKLDEFPIVPCRRSGMVGLRDKLYIIGLESVACYDVKTGQCSSLANLPSPQTSSFYFTSDCTLRNEIICATNKGDCYSYDTEKDAWREMESFPEMQICTRGVMVFTFWMETDEDYLTAAQLTEA